MLHFFQSFQRHCSYSKINKVTDSVKTFIYAIQESKKPGLERNSAGMRGTITDKNNILIEVFLKVDLRFEIPVDNRLES